MVWHLSPAPFFLELCTEMLSLYLHFFVGIFMGYLDVKHNSLIPSICVHFAINLMSTASGFILNYAENESALMIIFNLLIFIIFFAGLIAFILFCRQNKLPKSNIHQQFRSLNLFLTSPAAVIAAAVYIIILMVTTFKNI